MSEAESYTDYVRLAQVLEAAQPLSPVTDRTTWVAEHFFIVCHQTIELWVGQVLLDLEEAARRSSLSEWPEVVGHLGRALSLVDLLDATLGQLDHLSVEHFHEFRPFLGDVSAAESVQMAQLLDGPRMASVAGLVANLERARDEPQAGWRREAGHLVDVLCAGIRRWRAHHRDVADRLIGDLPGTGGTNGVAYLGRRIDAVADESASVLAGDGTPQ
jgi:tryptophan 2,3-dioxygenase